MASLPNHINSEYPQALITQCPFCGSSNRGNDLFCESCGSYLAAVAGATQPAPKPSISERKHATVLFVDLVGSTAAISELDPEDAMNRLRPALNAMRRVAEEFEGTVARVTGDGLMALFGAPRALEGHAQLACRAALAIHAELALLPVQAVARIGLHSGELIATELSDAPLGDGAFGATLHLASRMEQLAPAGGTYVSAAIFHLVGDHLDLQFVGTREVKGFARPVDVFELKGLAQRAGTPLPSPSFVGRGAEITLLEKWLEGTYAGKARVVAVAASPGVGKSRLCHEFVLRCRARRVRVLAMRALPYGHATPYQPVLELARQLLHVEPGIPREQARRRVRRVMRTFGLDVERDFDVVIDFLGLGSEAASSLDPQATQARLFGIVRDLLRVASSRPTLVLIEDLHWLDAASERFVRHFVESVRGTRTFALLNFRPDYDAAWLQRLRATVIELQELGERATRAIASELIGPDPRLAPIRELIAARSGGNPLFVDALVHSLRERCVLTGTTGALRLGTADAAIELPASIQSVLGARIDGLDTQDRRLLQVAAVVGLEFDLELLRLLTDRPQTELQGTMDRLCAAGLVEQVPGRGRVYSFNHPLTREVAYAAQLKAHRSALHANVARALQSFYSGPADEFAGLISHHYEAAGQNLEAAHYLVRAALWIGKSDSTQALRFWSHACKLVEDIPRSASNDALRMLVHGQVVNHGWRAGLSHAEAKRHSLEAQRYASELGDTMTQVMLISGYARFVGATGSADRYVALVLEALALVAALDEPGRTAMLKAQLAQAYRFAGLLREAMAANSAALRRASEISKPDAQMMGFRPLPWIMSTRGSILVELGRFARARHWLDQVIAMASLEPVVQFIPHYAYVRLAYFQRDTELAAAHAERVAWIAERSGIPYLQVYRLRCAGLRCLTAGDLEGAVSELGNGLKLCRRSGAARDNEASFLAEIAEAHFLAGRQEAAVATAKRALAVARRRKSRLAQCHAHMVLAAALGKLGDPAARQSLESAEALVRETGSAAYATRLVEALGR